MHIDKVDRQRLAAELRTFARVATQLDTTDTATLCAGMPPSDSGAATVCNPAGN